MVFSYKAFQKVEPYIVEEFWNFYLLKKLKC